MSRVEGWLPVQATLYHKHHPFPKHVILFVADQKCIRIGTARISPGKYTYGLIMYDFLDYINVSNAAMSNTSK